MKDTKTTKIGSGSTSLVELNNAPSALQMYQRAIREWGGSLDPSELAVVLFVIDKTLGWGKVRALIKAKDFMIGDHRVYTGLQIGRTKLFGAIASLEGRGVIKRHPDPQGREIRCYSVNVGWAPSALREPVPTQSAARTTPSVTRTPPVRYATTRERIRGEGIREKEDVVVSASPRPVSISVEKIREEVSAASAASRSAPAARTHTLPDRVAGAEVAFRTALEETFPQIGFGAWSTVEKAKVRAKIKTWIVKDGTLPDFVDWAVRNWAAIIAKQFGWMTRHAPPAVPEIGFLLSFMSQFLECRAEGKLDKWLAAPERTEFEKLTTRGLSEAEAAAEIGARRATESLKEEMASVQIKARARVRQAQIVEKRTEAMAALPVHPQSEIARKARGETIPKLSGKDVPEVDWANIQLLDPNWEPPE